MTTKQHPFEVLGEHAIYPGHAAALACEIALVFDAPAEAFAPTEHSWCQALAHNDVSGAGGNVYAAVEFLLRLQRGEPLADVLAWADAGWRSLCASNRFPKEPETAVEQARRFLAVVDVEAWVKR